MQFIMVSRNLNHFRFEFQTFIKFFSKKNVFLGRMNYLQKLMAEVEGVTKDMLNKGLVESAWRGKH